MRVTNNLTDWLALQMQERGWSFSEMGRITGKPYQTFQRIVHHSVENIQDDTADALCRLFGISTEDLQDIVDGKKRCGQAKHDCYSRKAEALFRWLNHDKNRCLALRAMGYHGDLPH